MIETVLIDSGVLVAAVHASEPRHVDVVQTLSRAGYHFVVPALCIAEATYLIERKFGARAEAAFLESLAEFEVIAPDGRDWVRIAELVRQYADFPLGGTDASVVALAERLDAEWLLTLDRRHFTAVRPNHIERPRLLP